MFLFKGPNALIQYSIVGGDGAFRVTENGDVIVNASLDYEVETKYEFQVKKDYFWRLYFLQKQVVLKNVQTKIETKHKNKSISKHKQMLGVYSK